MASRKPRPGVLRCERIVSSALADNPLGDPHEREVFVYLPAGYDDEPDRRYPVVVLLTGFTGIGESPWQRSFFDEAVHERLDRLIGTGACPPMIVAAPDCITALGGSQFVDSTAVGRYETFVVREVVPFVDRTFRTLASRDHRGVCGKSSGGYGALRLAMRHPRVFGALASHSGDAYFDYCYRFDFVKCWDALRSAGGLDRWLKDLRKHRRIPGEKVHALNIVAMAAAYSPDPSRPGRFDLPFDMETGEERPEVMRRWRRHDPVAMCARYAKALRSLRGVFVDCGLRDEYALHAGARILSRRLRELGVEHVHQEFDDGHRAISYRYDVSFPLLGRWLSP